MTMEIAFKVTRENRRCPPAPAGASPEFRCALLACSGAVDLPPQLAPRATGPAAQVLASFGPSVLTLRGDDGAELSMVLVPSTHVAAPEVDGPVDEDSRVVHVVGAFPTWSVTLRLESEEAARRFGEQLSSAAVGVIRWMHEQGRQALTAMGVAADGGREDPTIAPVVEAGDARRGHFLCGGYVLLGSVQDREHRLVQAAEMQEARFCWRWMELHGSPGEEQSLGLRFYSHCGPGAGYVEQTVWDDLRNTNLFELAGHLMLLRQSELRGCALHAREVGRLTIIAFRSAAEAEAWADMAIGKARRDDKLVEAARGRLAQCLQPATRGGDGAEAGMECFVRDDVDLQARSRERDARPEDPRSLHWRAQCEKEDREISEAVEACRNASAPVGLCGSATVVVSATESVVITR